MSKKIILSLIAVFALSCFTSVDISEAMPTNRAGQGQTPKLTEAQQADLQKMTIAFIKEMQTVETNLAVKEAEYEAVMLGDNPDPKKAGALAGEVATLRHDIFNKSVAFHDKISKEFGFPMDMCNMGMACPAARTMEKAKHGAKRGGKQEKSK